MDIENEEIDEQADSSPAEQEPQEQNQSADSEQSSEPVQAAPTPKADPTPFHEHPRFKEVIDQKNNLARQLEEIRRENEEFRRQFEKSQKAAQPKQQDALLERLKGIDPEFADRIAKIGNVDTLSEKLERFEQWQQQQEAQALRQQAISMRDRFWDQNKVPAEDRELYNDILTARSSKAKSLDELPALLKDVHEALSKRFTSVQREATKKLVEGKKADAQRPQSQPKGQSVKPGQKAEYSKNPQEAKAQLIKDIVADVRAGKDI